MTLDEDCENCISREDAIKQCGFGMTSLHIADCLRRLPSIALQSKPEIGYWIHHKESADHAEHWECSKCHRTTMTYPFCVNGNDYDAMYYCPKCGIKMQEVEK